MFTFTLNKRFITLIPKANTDTQMSVLFMLLLLLLLLMLFIVLAAGDVFGRMFVRTQPNSSNWSAAIEMIMIMA